MSALIEGAEAVAASDEQGAYEHASGMWKAAVDRVEAHLGEHRYLMGESLCFADLLLFAFAVRIHSVYHALLRPSPDRPEDLPHLHRFTRDVHQLPEATASTARGTRPRVAKTRDH